MLTSCGQLCPSFSFFLIFILFIQNIYAVEPKWKTPISLKRNITSRSQRTEANEADPYYSRLEDFKLPDYRPRAGQHVVAPPIGTPLSPSNNLPRHPVAPMIPPDFLTRRVNPQPGSPPPSTGASSVPPDGIVFYPSNGIPPFMYNPLNNTFVPVPGVAWTPWNGQLVPYLAGASPVPPQGQYGPNGQKTTSVAYETKTTEYTDGTGYSPSVTPEGFGDTYTPSVPSTYSTYNSPTAPLQTDNAYQTTYSYLPSDTSTTIHRPGDFRSPDTDSSTTTTTFNTKIFDINQNPFEVQSSTRNSEHLNNFYSTTPSENSKTTSLSSAIPTSIQNPYSISNGYPTLISTPSTVPALSEASTNIYSTSLSPSNPNVNRPSDGSVYPPADHDHLEIPELPDDQTSYTGTTASDSSTSSSNSYSLPEDRETTASYVESPIPYSIPISTSSYSPPTDELPATYSGNSNPYEPNTLIEHQNPETPITTTHPYEADFRKMENEKEETTPYESNPYDSITSTTEKPNNDSPKPIYFPRPIPAQIYQPSKSAERDNITTNLDVNFVRPKPNCTGNLCGEKVSYYTPPKGPTLLISNVAKGSIPPASIQRPSSPRSETSPRPKLPMPTVVERKFLPFVPPEQQIQFGMHTRGPHIFMAPHEFPELMMTNAPSTNSYTTPEYSPTYKTVKSSETPLDVTTPIPNDKSDESTVPFTTNLDIDTTPKPNNNEEDDDDEEEKDDDKNYSDENLKENEENPDDSHSLFGSSKFSTAKPDTTGDSDTDDTYVPTYKPLIKVTGYGTTSSPETYNPYDTTESYIPTENTISKETTRPSEQETFTTPPSNNDDNYHENFETTTVSDTDFPFTPIMPNVFNPIALTTLRPKKNKYNFPKESESTDVPPITNPDEPSITENPPSNTARPRGPESNNEQPGGRNPFGPGPNQESPGRPQPKGPGSNEEQPGGRNPSGPGPNRHSQGGPGPNEKYPEAPQTETPGRNPFGPGSNEEQPEGRNPFGPGPNRQTPEGGRPGVPGRNPFGPGPNQESPERPQPKGPGSNEEKPEGRNPFGPGPNRQTPQTPEGGRPQLPGRNPFGPGPNQESPRGGRPGVPGRNPFGPGPNQENPERPQPKGPGSNEEQPEGRNPFGPGPNRQTPKTPEGGRPQLPGRNPFGPGPNQETPGGGRPGVPGSNEEQPGGRNPFEPGPNEKYPEAPQPETPGRNPFGPGPNQENPERPQPKGPGSNEEQPEGRNPFGPGPNRQTPQTPEEGRPQLPGRNPFGPGPNQESPRGGRPGVPGRNPFGPGPNQENPERPQPKGPGSNEEQPEGRNPFGPAPNRQTPQTPEGGRPQLPGRNPFGPGRNQETPGGGRPGVPGSNEEQPGGRNPFEPGPNEKYPEAPQPETPGRNPFGPGPNQENPERPQPKGPGSNEEQPEGRNPFGPGPNRQTPQTPEGGRPQLPGRNPFGPGPNQESPGEGRPGVPGRNPFGPGPNQESPERPQPKGPGSNEEQPEGRNPFGPGPNRQTPQTPEGGRPQLPGRNPFGPGPNQESPGEGRPGVPGRNPVGPGPNQKTPGGGRPGVPGSNEEQPGGRNPLEPGPNEKYPEAPQPETPGRNPLGPGPNQESPERPQPKGPGSNEEQPGGRNPFGPGPNRQTPQTPEGGRPQLPGRNPFGPGPNQESPEEGRPGVPGRNPFGPGPNQESPERPQPKGPGSNEEQPGGRNPFGPGPNQESPRGGRPGVPGRNPFGPGPNQESPERPQPKGPGSNEEQPGGRNPFGPGPNRQTPGGPGPNEKYPEAPKPETPGRNPFGPGPNQESPERPHPKGPGSNEEQPGGRNPFGPGPNRQTPEGGKPGVPFGPAPKQESHETPQGMKTLTSRLPPSPPSISTIIPNPKFENEEASSTLLPPKNTTNYYSELDVTVPQAYAVSTGIPPLVPNRVRGKIRIVCKEDGLEFGATTIFPFTGEIFAKDRKRIHACTKNYTNEENPSIFLPFEECGVRNAGEQTQRTQYHMQVVVVVDQIDGSSSIQSYMAQCVHQRTNSNKQALPRRIDEALEELRLVPTKLEQQAVVPSVDMQVLVDKGHDGFGPEVAEVDIGMPLAIRWKLTPASGSYGFHVRNCFVEDSISGMQMMLIDEAGCSSDATILSHPHYDIIHDTVTARLWAFKVPDQTKLKIHCDIRICSEISSQGNFSSCAQIPTPPFCPDVITSPPNSIIYDADGAFRKRRRDTLDMETQSVRAALCMGDSCALPEKAGLFCMNIHLVIASTALSISIFVGSVIFSVAMHKKRRKM